MVYSLDGTVLLPPAVKCPLGNVQFVAERFDGFSVLIAVDDFFLEICRVLGGHGLISLYVMRLL